MTEQKKKKKKIVAMADRRRIGSGYCNEDGIYRSLHPPVHLPSHPHQGFPAFLFGGAICDAANAAKPVLVDAATGFAITCAEFRRLVAAVGSGLSSLLGVAPGDVVLLLLGNTVYFPVIFHAVLSLGAVATMANPANTTADIGRQLKDSAARFVVTMPELVPKLGGCSLPMVLLDDDEDTQMPGSRFLSFKLLLESDPKQLPDVRIRLGDSAALLYSSGTTGPSKGVVLSHGNLISAVSSLAGAEDETKTDKEDIVSFILVPLFHVAGLLWLGCSLLREAGTMVVLKKFDLIDMLEAIQRYRVTNLPVVPPIVVALTRHPAAEKYDLSSLRRAGSGAAPLAKNTLEAFLAKFPQIKEFAQGYGMTETTGMGTVGNAPFGSAGRLMPTFEAKVVDVESGKLLPPNCRGELWLRGPCIMQGYLNNPVATAATIDREGWLHTGDLVIFNSDGYMYVVDRLKELIKYKGFQVAPAELEALLLTHPAIADAAVIPFPDEEAGEVPLAYIARAPEKSLTEAEVMDFVAQQVAPYKRVRRVAFLDAIPKSSAGKILRKDLVRLAHSRSKL